MITSEELRQVLSYDKNTGVFIWSKNMGGFAKAGSIAGATDSKGYRQIRVKKKLYLAHRLAWLYVHGKFPDLHLDHIDRNPQNNAISNLRECSRFENHQNMSLRRNSTSGFTGVCYEARFKKWTAHISFNGKTIVVGRFKTKELAIEARIKAKKEIHKFHPYQVISTNHMTLIESNDVQQEQTQADSR